ASIHRLPVGVGIPLGLFAHVLARPARLAQHLEPIAVAAHRRGGDELRIGALLAMGVHELLRLRPLGGGEHVEAVFHEPLVTRRSRARNRRRAINTARAAYGRAASGSTAAASRRGSSTP